MPKELNLETWIQKDLSEKEINIHKLDYNKSYFKNMFDIEFELAQNLRYNTNYYRNRQKIFIQKRVRTFVHFLIFNHIIVYI